MSETLEKPLSVSAETAAAFPALEITIAPVESAEDFQAAYQLLREFYNLITFEHKFNGATMLKEIDDGLAEYRQTGGVFVLARVNGAVAGCLAVRPLNGTIGEIKRMFVRPEFRGLRLGDTLMEDIIARARKMGYTELYLDSLHSFQHAHKIYYRAGFTNIEPYNDNPPDRVGFFAKKL